MGLYLQQLLLEALHETHEARMRGKTALGEGGASVSESVFSDDIGDDSGQPSPKYLLGNESNTRRNTTLLRRLEQGIDTV